MEIDEEPSSTDFRKERKEHFFYLERCISLRFRVYLNVIHFMFIFKYNRWTKKGKGSGVPTSN